MAITSRQLTFQLSGGPPYGIRLQGGDSSPFVVSKIRPASKAEAIGLQECDVIVAVNGITSRGLSHSALTALMDSVNTTLSLLVLRGPSAFYEVDIVQQSLDAQLTALTDSQKSSLLLASSQPEIVSPSRDNGLPSWSDNNGGSNSIFRLQSVNGKQRQHRQNNANIHNTGLPTDATTYPDKADNYYSREEQSFNEDGVLRNTVEETERKTSDGLRMTTVTRREYSTRTTNSNDGPQIAQEFFQSAPLSGGIQEWFGERTEDGTYQTRSLNHITGVPLNQQSIVNTTWSQNRGTAEQLGNITAQRRFTSEPQVRIYETPGVKQAQNIVLPDFQISIEAGPKSRTGTRIQHPIVTVTPAEEHDVSNTVTLVGPSSWQHTQHQQQVEEYQEQAPVSARDHPKHAVHSMDSGQVSTYEYYEPQTNRSKPQQVTRSRDIPEVSYDYKSTPVEVTWHEPSVVKGLRKLDEGQGHINQGHVDNITVSVGDRSHFTVNKSERDQYYYDVPVEQVSSQPYHATLPYPNDVHPVQDLYQNVYKTDQFSQDQSTNFDQRSRPAPVTYGQPYQQKPVAPYQSPQPISPPIAPYPYQPSNSGLNFYQAPPGGETRYQYPYGGEYMYQRSPSQSSNADFHHQPPVTAKTGNKLPLNPHFREEQASNQAAAMTLNERQDRMPYTVTPYVETQEPMSYSMAIKQATYEGGTRPLVVPHRPITAHNTWSQQNTSDYDPRYHVITNDVTPPTGYMIPQQAAPPVAAAPPPPAPPPPPPANPYKVYGLAGGSNDPDKRLLESKVNLANSVAHSVTSPANMNSRGQKMFLRRQQNAHKWTKSGPDPLPESLPISSNGSNTGRAGHPPITRPPPAAAIPGAYVERWNSVADSGPVRTGVSLLRRSESADHVTNISPSSAAAAGINRSMDADHWTSNVQNQVPAAVNPAAPSQTLSYRPVKFQFQKPASFSSQNSQQWNQASPADEYRVGLPPGVVASSHNIAHSSSSGFTDL